MRATQDELRETGNWLALVGAIVYFLEWAVIIPANVSGSPALGAKPSAIVSFYAQHANWAEVWAGWFSLVLLGRIAFVAGVRHAFRRAPRELPFADLALGTMTVSVAIEIIGYGLAAGAAWLAAHGGSTAAIVGLDSAAKWLIQIIAAPIGASALALSFAMLRSGLFPRWLSWVGLVAGAVVAAYGAFAGPFFVSSGTVQTIGGVADGFGMLAIWIWMLATGIILFRRAQTRRVAAIPEQVPAS